MQTLRLIKPEDLRLEEAILKLIDLGLLGQPVIANRKLVQTLLSIHEWRECFES